VPTVHKTFFERNVDMKEAEVRALVAEPLAPVADMPVLEIDSAAHILADLTLGLGKVVHDYLQPGVR